MYAELGHKFALNLFFGKFIVIFNISELKLSSMILFASTLLR